jgi:hypothetical protein
VAGGCEAGTGDVVVVSPGNCKSARPFIRFPRLFSAGFIKSWRGAFGQRDAAACDHTFAPQAFRLSGKSGTLTNIFDDSFYLLERL